MANAAESVAFNIVEGCGSTSSKEFARFLDISIKSTCELEYQLQLASDSGLLSRRAWSPLSAETIEIRRMLCGLRRKVLDAGQRTPTDNH
jgi:four helix bundle protein